MGKIYSVLTRPVRTFNVANRAEKVISQKKPIPAPQHASTQKQKEMSDKVNPSFLEDHYRKDGHLDQRLKDVFVTSTDPQETTTITSSKESKPLPQSRQSSDEFLFDSIYSSTVVPIGKCSLRQIFTFLSQHKRNPETYSSEHIAAEYKLDKKVVDDILKHFKLYMTVAPKSEEIPQDDFQDMIDRATILQAESKRKLEKGE